MRVGPAYNATDTGTGTASGGSGSLCDYHSLTDTHEFMMYAIIMASLGVYTMTALLTEFLEIQNRQERDRASNKKRKMLEKYFQAFNTPESPATRDSEGIEIPDTTGSSLNATANPSNITADKKDSAGFKFPLSGYPKTRHGLYLLVLVAIGVIFFHYQYDEPFLRSLYVTP